MENRREGGVLLKNLTGQLIDLRKREYQFFDLNVDDLILNMIKHIGTTDPVLRDELIYTTFGELIYHQQLLDHHQLTALLNSK